MSIFLMARTVLKSLFSRPATVKYPFGPVISREKSRGRLNIDISKCIFCGICQKKCPTAALTVSRQAKKWRIARMRCIICGNCVEVCPKKCLSLENRYTPPALAKEEEEFSNA